ncbi:unnamed protein product [Camellia sinensis]
MQSIQGGADYTPECESQPHFRMGNNSIQSGGTVYTSEGESQPDFVMGGNSIQVALCTLPKVNHDLISSWVVIIFSRVMLFILAKVNHNRVSSWVVILLRIMDHRHDMYISPSQPRPQVLMGGTSGPPLTYGK